MTYEFLEHGTYTITLTITNSNDVSSTYTKMMELPEPVNDPNFTKVIILGVMAIVLIFVITRFLI